jgi:hypothetical protein
LRAFLEKYHLYLYDVAISFKRISRQFFKKRFVRRNFQGISNARRFSYVLKVGLLMYAALEDFQEN